VLGRLRDGPQVATARTVLAVARENRVSVLAAGLAYHAFNSLIPATILTVLALSQFGGFGALSDMLAATSGSKVASFLQSARKVTSQASGQWRAVVLAGVVLVWSSGRLFEATQRTFTEVYGTDEYESGVERLRDIGIAFATIVLGAALMVGLTVWLVVLTREWLWRLVAPPLLVGVLVGVFLPMYYLFPRTDISLREALPGATFTAVVWVVSAIGFSLYASTSQSVQLYGIAGGVLLLLTWMYVVGLALPVGTILNVVVAEEDYGVEVPD
jgi:membrane protein